MDPRAAARLSGQAGLAGVATVVAAAFALVLFVTVADLIVAGYTRAVARAAVAEAARAGARADEPVPACAARATDVVTGLLGPTARRSVTVRCAAADAVTVRAAAEVVVTPWWPGLPARTSTVGATARREVWP